MAENETKDVAKSKNEDPEEAPASASELKQANKEEKSETQPVESPEETAPQEVKTDSEIEPELTNEFRLPSASEQHPLNHKSVKKVLIGALIVVTLAILGAVALWVTHDTPVSQSDSEIVYTQGAAVTAVEGDVEFNAGQGWNTVESGTDLKEGYSLRTLSGSRTIITLDEGSAIRLDSDSVVTIAKLTVDEVIIENEQGQVYTRVVPSETRVFVVTVDDQNYQAIGTAYKTVNLEEEKGVEVYHSKVDVKDKSQVNEGEAYFTKSKDDAKNGKVAKLDLEKLAGDDFLNWNKTKDEGEKEFSDKLGILKDLGEKDEPEEAAPPAPSPGTPAGITLSGSKGTNGINLSWSSNGINVSDGFKVTYDKSDTTPSYGENSAKYMSPGTTSYVLKLTDGKVWNIRVCAYRAEAGSCDSYSNLVQIAAPYVEKEKVGAGTVNIEPMSGSVLSWTYTGTAPYGFKVVWNTSGSPTYPVSGANSGYKYLSSPSSSSFDLATKITDSGNYHVRVCKYTSGTQTEKCVDDSDTQMYIVAP